VDILRFIDSKAIRDYWKRIGFKADPLQQAFLVFNCVSYDITLKEKQAAYMEIINNAGDYKINQRPRFPKECSLKDYLEEMLSLQRKYINQFYASGEGVTYVGEIYTSKYDSSKIRETYKAKTFDELKRVCGPLGLNEHIEVSKYTLDYKQHPIFLSFNHDFEIAGIGILGESAEDEDGNILFGLNEFFFDFPYPFKKNDLVYDILLGPTEPLLLLEDPKKDEQTVESLLKDGNDTDMIVECEELGDIKRDYLYYYLLYLDYDDDSNNETISN